MSPQLVMVVDDDLDIRETLAEWLVTRGFRVVTAANGRDALRELRAMTEPPAVILLDLMMPVMDGYAFLEERAQDPALAAVPVAILTAGRAVSQIAGDTQILHKPIHLPGLLRVLGELGSESTRTRE